MNRPWRAPGPRLTAAPCCFMGAAPLAVRRRRKPNKKRSAQGIQPAQTVVIRDKVNRVSIKSICAKFIERVVRVIFNIVDDTVYRLPLSTTVCIAGGHDGNQSISISADFIKGEENGAAAVSRLRNCTAIRPADQSGFNVQFVFCKGALP